MKTTKQQTENSNLAKENGELLEERNMMKNQTTELSQERDDLNRTLGFILKFDNFPVKDFCPDKKCQPCQKGWIIFKEKCYLFYEEPRPWKTWEESRKFCQDKHADLVVIDDLQEQEFVSNHTKYYFDNYHGYWLGLQETNNTWIWVDGHEDTLRFWVKEELGKTGSYTLLIPGRNPTESWDKADELFTNKFICEHEALTVSV
ncbi:C-type lectin domain family 17, member A-like [Anableps anableps]